MKGNYKEPKTVEKVISLFPPIKNQDLSFKRKQK